ncbi:hypothetical protein VSR72_25895 [Paraburkholderia sp. JHI869]
MHAFFLAFDDSLRGLSCSRVGSPPPKVRLAVAEIPVMARKHPDYPDKPPIWAEARALEASIRVIRRAQGKKNPEDFPAGSPECTAAMDEFVRDVCRALEIDIDTLGKD